ncbi:DNA cytosine methyltransferase [Acidithiobacillus albertensis]|nr:DNA cytosine methyltransferase [Acidithiobacillus albertensis]
MLNSQFILGINEEITVDLFAGGGGMSTAIEQAIGRYVDVAVNHNADALSMHEVNHPQTRHYIGDVFEVDPREASDGRAVGLLHLSPDCTHHSQASGGQPRDRKTRALSWVGKRWAGQVKPRVITLENVKQILQWGPLVAKRDKATGRVLKLDGTIAEPGEVVPIRQQYLVPDKKRIGRTWQAFVSQLRDMGYAVEWKILCAADFGAPTTRERLFMVARCDGKPIHWPEPTHTKVKTKGKKRWRSAAECIDWSVPCPSIFDRGKPLADATLRRIARGLKKYVLESANPFIVPIAHYNGRDACQPAQEPLRTITAYPKGGAFAVASPVLVQTGYGERAGQAPRSLDLDAPLGTVVAGGTKHAVASAYLAQMNGGFNTTPGHDLRRPASTITNTGSQQQFVMAHLTHLRGHCDARDMEDPLMTISAGGQHHGVVGAFLSRQFGCSVGHEADAPLGTVTAGGGGKSALVECALSPDDEAGALRVAAFLIRYYGEGGQWGDLHDPMATITTKDRLALVTVHVEGTPYVIVDIGLRMLQPRELYRAQGFPDTYIIDHGHDGRKFSKSAQVRMCGNSVSPPPAIALIRANYTDASGKRMVA